MRFFKKSQLSSPELRPHEVCILAGAGVSLPAPSSFPTAAPLLEHLLRDLARGYSTADAYLSLLAPPPVKPRTEWEYMRFEFIMDRLALYDPNESFLRNIYSRPGARPNAYHVWLAKALSLGANVITTNFDCMIENTYEGLGTTPARLPVLITDEECERYLEQASEGTAGDTGTLLKLHGSVDGAMAARFPQLAGSRGTGPRYHVAENLMLGRTLLVLGYSGGDDFDVMPMLGHMYAYGRQSIIWIEHAASTELESVASRPLLPVIIKPKRFGGMMGQSSRIRGDSATAVNFLCHDSFPSMDAPAAPAPAPLPPLDLTDWERLSLLNDLMKGSLYAEQAMLRPAVERLLPKAAEADVQSKCAALIHKGVVSLFIERDDKGPAEDEIVLAIRNAEPPLRRRLASRILLLEAWLEHTRGALDARDEKLRALMQWCEENDNWEVMTNAPDWAFRYCEDLLEDDRRSLYLKVGWHLMIWSRDLQVALGMLSIVEDAEALEADGVSMPFSYWEYQEGLQSALYYNQRLGNLKEARNAAANLQRVEWVWNRVEEHKRYGEMVKQLDDILSRRVRKRSF